MSHLVFSEEVDKFTLDELVQYAELHLDKDKRGKPCCPACGSGTKASKTSALALIKDSKRFYCHSCDKHFSIVDLVQVCESLNSPTDALNSAKAMFNKNLFFPDSKKITKTNSTQMKQTSKTPDCETKPDYSEYISKCETALTEFLQDTQLNEVRGISCPTLKKYRIGYDKEFIASRENPIPTPCYIVPNDYSFKARHIDQSKNFKIPKDRQAMFNSTCLATSSTPKWIVEGEFDALSLLDIETDAVALGGTGNVNKFINMVTEATIQAPIVLYLDADESGTKATNDIKKALSDRHIAFIEANAPEEYKDANDFLQADRNAFIEFVNKENSRATKHQEDFQKKLAEKKAEIETEKTKKREQSSMLSVAETFISELVEYSQRPKLPTGFRQLDYWLSGGFHPELYVLGAGTSMGKTTFSLQLADNVAKAGTDILYFSLEVSKRELLCRTLARMVGETHPDLKISYGDILRNFAGISQKSQTEIGKAIEEYKETIAPNLFIFDAFTSNEKMTTSFINDTIANHCNEYGKHPFVVVDYLQYLGHDDVRLTEKERNKENAMILKKASMRYDTPMLVLSSINRTSYFGTIGVEALKESGDIEYSADVILLMQYSSLADCTDKNEANKLLASEKAKEERDISLHIPKNRNGIAGETVKLQANFLKGEFKEKSKSVTLEDFEL